MRRLWCWARGRKKAKPRGMTLEDVQCIGALDYLVSEEFRLRLMLPALASYAAEQAKYRRQNREIEWQSRKIEAMMLDLKPNLKAL